MESNHKFANQTHGNFCANRQHHILTAAGAVTQTPEGSTLPARTLMCGSQHTAYVALPFHIDYKPNQPTKQPNNSKHFFLASGVFSASAWYIFRSNIFVGSGNFVSLKGGNFDGSHCFPLPLEATTFPTKNIFLGYFPTSPCGVLVFWRQPAAPPHPPPAAASSSRLLSSSHHLIISSSHHLIISSSPHHLIISSHPLIISSPHHLIISSSHLIISSSHHFISSSHHLIISSSHHLIISSSHHLIISSSHHLITSSHHLMISSSHHLIISSSHHLMLS